MNALNQTRLTEHGQRFLHAREHFLAHVTLPIGSYDTLCRQAFSDVVFSAELRRLEGMPKPPPVMTWSDLEVTQAIPPYRTPDSWDESLMFNAASDLNITLLIARALESHSRVTLMVDRVKVGEIAIENGRVVTRS